VQQACGIDRENGADGARAQRLGAPAQQIGHDHQGGATGHGLQNLCLQPQQRVGIVSIHEESLAPLPHNNSLAA
jgi:hypothetical protein